MTTPDTTDAVAKGIHDKTCVFHKFPNLFNAVTYGTDKDVECRDFNEAAQAAIAADRAELERQGYVIVKREGAE